MSIRAAISDAMQDATGGLSVMRIATMFVCVIVLGMWVVFCFVEGRLIPVSWEMVALVGGSQGAKAIQRRFEHDEENLQDKWERGKDNAVQD
jgi:hypothetical protein